MGVAIMSEEEEQRLLLKNTIQKSGETLISVNEQATVAFETNLYPSPPTLVVQDTPGPGAVSGLQKLWRFDCLPCIPVRYRIALVACLGFVNVYGLRVNLSVAIVQMVSSTATYRNGSAKV